MGKKMKNGLRCFLAVLLLGSFGLAAAACGGGDEGKREITVWVMAPLVANYENVLSVTPTDKQALFTKEIVEKFEKENDIKVTLADKGLGETLSSNLAQVINTNKIGDIVYGETNLQRFYATGKYRELEFTDAEMANLVTQAHSSMKSKTDGKVYSVPIFTGTLALSINKNVLRDAGVIDADDAVAAKYADAGINPLAPETWEDLLAVCRDVKEYYVDAGERNSGAILMNATSGDSRWRALPVMRTAGGDFVDENGSVNIDTAANVKAFDMMRKLQQTAPEGSMDTTNLDLFWDYFFNDKAAYVVDGADLIARSYKYPDLEGNVAVSEIPVFEGVNKKSNLLCGTCYLSIPVQKNYDLAKKFVDFCLTDFVQEKLIPADCRIPVKLDVLNRAMEEGTVNENMRAFITPLISGDYSFDGAIPEFLNNSSIIWEKWDSFLKKVYATTTDIGGLLEDTQAEMKAAQDRT